MPEELPALPTEKIIVDPDVGSRLDAIPELFLISLDEFPTATHAAGFA